MEASWWTNRIIVLIIVIICVHLVSTRIVSPQVPMLRSGMLLAIVEGVTATLIMDYIYM